MRSVMFQALLLCAICPVVLLSSAVTGPGADETRLLQVTIPDSPPASAILGGTLMLPCFVSLSLPLPTTSSLGRLAMLNMPRVKWSMLSSGRETEILVARGERVKISETYRDRASLPNYASSPSDLTLQLDGLRHNDTGFYRCEVQQGLEDAHDLTQVKVKGVVFHYRHASSRYAFSFEDAKDACGDIGAQITTPEQLLAAYHSGYEQCDAGWLADGSVRYPIHVPRERCYGDMESLPGVRNYGMLDPDELYDVYCYIENIHGEVFHGSTFERFTLDEAKAYCEQQGAELANTGQLYAAWNDGLNYCSPGWLADGSVRYPIVTPRERCGGSEPGVKTVYRYSNQTGFPEPHSRYDVYCFKGNIDSRTVSSLGYLATEPEDIGQDIVTLADHQEEFSLGHVTEHTENEAQGAVEALSIFSEPTQTKPIATQSDMVYTTNSNILTTPTQTEPTQSSLQESSTNPVVTESVPAIYQEANYNQPMIVEEQDIENGTVDEVQNHNHTQYEHTSEGNLEPEEQVEYQTHTESEPNTTVDNLEPSLEPELQETVEAKPFQNMSDTKLDDQDGSHEEDHLTDIEAIGGNTTEARKFNEDRNHTTESTYSGTIEGSTREMTTASSNETGLLVTDSEDSDLHSSPESTTESSLIAGLSQSTQRFEPSQNRTLVLSVSSVVDPLEMETGHISAESYIESSSSATNESDHNLKEIITPTHQAEKQTESIDGSGDDVLSLTLLTTPVPHLLGTSVFQKALELEGSSSQEVEISVSKSNAPFEEEVVEQVKQEGVGAAPVLYTTARPIAEAETTASQYKSPTEDEASGKEESSGGEYLVTEYPTLPHPHATTIATNPFKSTDLPLLNITESTEVNESESHTTNFTMEVPVLHHIALTPGWDTTTTPTPAQESQAEVEFISDTPLLRENPVSSTGSDTTAVSITEKPKHAENSTFAVAIDDDEHENDLTTFANLGNSKEEDIVTAPTQHTSPPARPVEAMQVRTSISDDCVENPCANGGTCVDSDTGVQCLCLPTYGGEFCQEDLEQCEPGWDKFQGNCYKYFSKRQSWEVAELHCQLSGGHLVSVMSPEEQDFINGKYKEYQWTGLNDRTIEGDFRWSDGNPLLYENWYNAQPDSYFLSGEDCVVMVWHDDGRWSDVPCNYHLSYTCKKGTTFCGQPPLVMNAKQFGKQRVRYEINAQVRYYCQEGFVPRYNPIIRCQTNGQWEEPQITCTAKPDEPNDGQITVPTVKSKEVFVKDTATEKATSQWRL